MAYEKKYEHKPNRGSLFYNDKKDQASDPSKAPSWRGDGLLDLGELGLGTGRAEVWLSIWVNEIAGQKGPKNKRLSLSISQKEPREVEVSQPEASFEDDIPF